MSLWALCFPQKGLTYDNTFFLTEVVSNTTRDAEDTALGWQTFPHQQQGAGAAEAFPVPWCCPAVREQSTSAALRPPLAFCAQH